MAKRTTRASDIDDVIKLLPQPVIASMSREYSFGLEMRKLGTILSKASERQIEALLPWFYDALAEKGLPEESLAKMVFEMNKKLTDIG